MAQFANGSFTGTDGTELNAADSNFVEVVSAADNAVLYNGRLRWANGTGNGDPARYRHTATPPSADYEVSADLYVLGTTSTTFNAGVVARCSAGVMTCYFARWRHGTGIQLFRYANNVATQLGSTYALELSAGQTVRIRLRCNGSTISVYKDSDSSPVISATDATITAAGYAGVVSATNSTSDGVMPDNFSADTLTAGAATADGGTGAGTGSGTGGEATGGGSGTNGAADGGTGTSTGSGSGGTATGGAAGSFTFDACENSTHSGALSGVSVNWTWLGGTVGDITSITNGSGTMTTGGMTISGLPTGAGCGLIRTTDGTVVAYQEGTVA